MGVSETKTIFAVWDKTNLITAQLKLHNLPLKHGTPRKLFFNFPLYA